MFIYSILCFWRHLKYIYKIISDLHETNMFIYSYILSSWKHLQYTHKMIYNLHETIILIFIYSNIIYSWKHLQ